MIVTHCIFTASLCCAPLFGAKAEPADDVDVLMGTSNSRWQLFPGATLPFGLMKLSPDNQGNPWNGDYEYTLGSNYEFSQLICELGPLPNNNWGHNHSPKT